MPIQFADLGKQTKDLLTKKYDYKTEFKAVTKSKENNVKIEAGTSGRVVEGYMKLFYKNKDFGKLEAEVHSNTECGDKAKIKLNKLVDHTSLTLSASSLCTVGLNAQFAKDKFAADVTLLHCEKNTNAAVSATANYKDVTVGALADFEAPNGTVVLKDANVGAEFKYKKLTATAKTANLRNEVALSVFHKFNKQMHWGSSVVVRPQEGFSPIVALGLAYKLGGAASFKAKGDNSGNIAVAVEHQLKEPALRFNLAAEYNIAKNCCQPARQFGFSVTYGS